MPEQEEAQPVPEGQPPGRKGVLHVRDHEVKTAYANVCLLASTREEIVLNFGLSFPRPNPEKPEVEMLVSNRIIMSLPAAKRLAIALSQAIQRHENAFGVIQLPHRSAGGQTSAEAPPTSR